MKGKGEPTILIDGIEVYENYICDCGCDKNIPVTANSLARRIPNFILGHNRILQNQTQEYKEYMREINLGEKNPAWGKHWKLSPETIEKQSEAKSGKNNPLFGKFDEDNPLWLGGYSQKIYGAKQRGLGFIPMNNLTEIANTMHHIDKKLVLFIPEKLHRSVPHNNETGQGLEVINNLAWKWFDEFGFKEYFIEPQTTLFSIGD